MPEPLSITTAVVGLLKTSWTVGVELKKFRSGVAVIDKTLNDLGEDVDALATVLSSMRDTFESITAEHGTGNLGSHWTNVAKAIENGNGILRELGEEIQQISKQVKFMDRNRKQLRLTLAEDSLAGLRTRLHSLRETLQLSLQAISILNQVEHHETLENICQEIRRLALKINKTIDSQRAVVQSPQDEANIAELQDLRECVRSAASLVSSASTELLSQAGDENDRIIIMSDFGDCFPVEHNLAMSRWIEASPSAIGVLSEDDADSSSDSDVDLEDEITTALLEDGQGKLVAGQLQDAERVLKKCSLRLDNVTWEQRGRRAMKQFSKHIEVLQSLLLVYYRLRHWPQAQATLMQKLKVQERSDRKTDLPYFLDVVELAKILQLRGETTQAFLHARRALIGFKKLQSERDVETCLSLLINLCHTGNAGDDVEGYMLMLSRMRANAPCPSTELILAATDEDLTPAVPTTAMNPESNNISGALLRLQKQREVRPLKLKAAPNHPYIANQERGRRSPSGSDEAGVLTATRIPNNTLENVVKHVVQSNDSSVASVIRSDKASSSVFSSTATDDTTPSSADSKPTRSPRPAQVFATRPKPTRPVSTTTSTEITTVPITQAPQDTENVRYLSIDNSRSATVASSPAKTLVDLAITKYLMHVVLRGSMGCGNKSLMR
jgi:hypothetical protein